MTMGFQKTASLFSLLAATFVAGPLLSADHNYSGFQKTVLECQESGKKVGLFIGQGDQRDNLPTHPYGSQDHVEWFTMGFPHEKPTTDRHLGFELGGDEDLPQDLSQVKFDWIVFAPGGTTYSCINDRTFIHLQELLNPKGGRIAYPLPCQGTVLMCCDMGIGDDGKFKTQISTGNTEFILTTHKAMEEVGEKVVTMIIKHCITSRGLAPLQNFNFHPKVKKESLRGALKIVAQEWLQEKFENVEYLPYFAGLREGEPKTESEFNTKQDANYEAACKRHPDLNIAKPSHNPPHGFILSAPRL